MTPEVTLEESTGSSASNSSMGSGGSLQSSRPTVQLPDTERMVVTIIKSPFTKSARKMAMAASAANHSSCSGPVGNGERSPSNGGTSITTVNNGIPPSDREKANEGEGGVVASLLWKPLYLLGDVVGVVGSLVSSAPPPPADVTPTTAGPTTSKPNANPGE